MGLSGSTPGPAGAPEPGEQRAVHEFLDRDHPRASISEGGRIVIEPGQVLDNIALAMERLDLDINTPVSIEEDVVPLNELLTLIQTLALGPTLAVHVVNTAMRIMSARYPEDLVRSPLPSQYDLRKIVPVPMSDREHAIAKILFNRRTASAVDLTEDDITEDVAPLQASDQLQVFVALFFMYGNKIGAMKYTTGIA